MAAIQSTGRWPLAQPLSLPPGLSQSSLSSPVASSSFPLTRGVGLPNPLGPWASGWSEKAAEP